MDEDEQGRVHEGEQGQVYEGTVRSYRQATDYGFITSSEFAKDIYFRSESLPDEFRAGIDGFCPVEGLNVTFKLHKLPDGKPQAKLIKVNAVEGRPLMGIVKSFDPARGYGFINGSAIAGDLFFDKKEVPPHINPFTVTGLYVRFEMRNDDKKGKYKAVSCLFKTEPAHPAQFYGEMPFYGAPPVGPMGMPFSPVGFPPGVVHTDLALHPPRPTSSSEPPLMPGMPMPGMAMPGMVQPLRSGGVAMYGVVKSFDPKTKYGFLTCAGMFEDIYFQAAHVLGNVDLVAGQMVSCILKYRADGQPYAKDITVEGQSGFHHPGDNSGHGQKRRNGKKGGRAKRARRNAQGALDAGRAAKAAAGNRSGEEDDWGDEGAEDSGACSGAYVVQAASQAKPRPSSSTDRLAELIDKDLFGVISIEFEKARGYGYLVCDETGEEMPFSDTRPEFAEGEEVGFRIRYGPQREPMAIALRLVDP